MKTHTEYVDSKSLSGNVSFIPTSTINHINVFGQDYSISIDEDAFAKAMEKYMSLNKPVYYKMECQSCGAPIEQKINDHILKCPYCHSVYAVGTKMVNAK